MKTNWFLMLKELVDTYNGELDGAKYDATSDISDALKKRGIDIEDVKNGIKKEDLNYQKGFLQIYYELGYLKRIESKFGDEGYENCIIKDEYDLIIYICLDILDDNSLAEKFGSAHIPCNTPEEYNKFIDNL